MSRLPGLQKSDQVVAAIRGTFKAVKGYITNVPTEVESHPDADDDRTQDDNAYKNRTSGSINLVHNINIVLPETSDLNVLNAIFRSLRDNLLR